jgi:hypothetical protein
MTDARALKIDAGGSTPLTLQPTDVRLDLEKLIITKLLIQANSGGGKSYAIRWLLEQTYGKVQHIVIDREGEFSTLRALHPYLLVGRDGDVAADIDTAKLLARKVLELGLSTVVDLSEMSPGQQRAYVRVFIDSLNHAPRSLWKDCIIVIDEAHIFAPESGKGSSEATESIALLLSTGRKRGFCVVLATQRLAKLNKDVAAECLNKLIGRTSNEDIKRAGEELAQGKQSSIQLRGLDPGYFWAYGPAISPEPVLVRTGKVKTQPPARGAERSTPPAAPEEIRAALAKELAELPKQAADEAQSVTNLTERVRTLTRELDVAKRGQPPAERVEVKVRDEGAIQEAVFNALHQLRTMHDLALRDIYERVHNGMESALGLIEQAQQSNWPPGSKEPPRPAIAGAIYPPRGGQVRQEHTRIDWVDGRTEQHTRVVGGNGKLPAGAVRMLQVLAQHLPTPVEVARLARLAGFAVRGRTFREYKRQLKAGGYVAENGRDISITDPGYSLVGAQPKMARGDAWRMWQSNLNAGQIKILDALRQEHFRGIEGVERGLLEQSMGMASRTFREYLRVLKQNSLVTISGNVVHLAPELAP